MPDNRDRYYAAGPAHPELAGLWLRAAGIELVGRDGRRETIAWERCEAVVWERDHCTVQGPDLELRIDGWFAKWSDLGRCIAVGIEAPWHGFPPRPLPTRATPPTEVLPRDQVREWLQLRLGQVYRVPILDRDDPHQFVLLGPACLAMVVLFVGAMGGLPTGQLVWLALPFAAVAAVGKLSLRRYEAGLVLDEDGIATGSWLGRHEQLGWHELTALEGRRLCFGSRQIELPYGDEAEIVLEAARLILDARRRGFVAAAPTDVPGAAISRLTSAGPEAPSTAISRTAGGMEE